MVAFTTVVGFKEGLHARPASELVKLCQTAKSDIKLIKDTLEVNPKSILGILTLGASHLDEIKVVIEGEDETAVETKMKDFFAKTSHE